jgi:hypothetical protein
MFKVTHFQSRVALAWKAGVLSSRAISWPYLQILVCEYDNTDKHTSLRFITLAQGVKYKKKCVFK